MTRREFLAASATMAMARAASAQATKPAEPFRFSVSTIMYPDSPLEVALEEIAKTGCQAVDLWEGHAKMQTNHMQWVEFHRGEHLRRIVESFGLKLFAFSIYWSPGDKRLQRLEWLKDAGGEVAVLGGGAGAGQPVEAGVSALQPLVEKAEKLGVKIAGENHGGSSLCSIASMREFVRLAKSPSLGIALAPYHVMGAKESVPEAIEAIGPKLFFFYAWQRAPGLKELPGDGALDFLPVLKALRKVGYPYPLNIFTHTHVPKEQMTAGVTAARQYLEGLAKQIGG
ncbi:MAG: sugar phosphate isomerase/epimerase [Planctomycetes bacterium]|nr:sugar phosphate isomerase/epimerase [Planctomycetota bacterium]